MTQFTKTTDFNAMPLDELIPLYRENKFGLPKWALSLASEMGKQLDKGGTSSVATPGGLQTNSKEAAAAVAAGIISVHMPENLKVDQHE